LWLLISIPAGVLRITSPTDLVGVGVMDTLWLELIGKHFLDMIPPARIVTALMNPTIYAKYWMEGTILNTAK